MSTISTRFVMPLLVFLLIFIPTISWADNIVQTSSLTKQANDKVLSLLFVGTSALNPDSALANKQALIPAEMRKLLTARGLQIFSMGIRPGESDATGVVAQSVSKFAPSHIVKVNVPSGVVSVSRSTGESGAASVYSVVTEVSDAKSATVIWTHSAEIKGGAFFGASNAEVAAAIVARMRSDGLIE